MKTKRIQSKFHFILLITIVLLILEISSKLLEYWGFLQLSFIFNIIGLLVINIFVIGKSIQTMEPRSFNNILGISSRSWFFLLLISFSFSLPWWFHENITVGSIHIVRRGLGSYSYSTLVKAPIFEEIYFRGLLLWYFRDKHSKNRNSLLNGFLFSLIHLPFVVFGINFIFATILLLTFILGYILSLIQLTHQNILLPIALHFIANLFLIIIGFPPNSFN